jgi:hypothetical protein
MQRLRKIEGVESDRQMWNDVKLDVGWEGSSDDVSHPQEGARQTDEIKLNKAEFSVRLILGALSNDRRRPVD